MPVAWRRRGVADAAVAVAVAVAVVVCEPVAAQAPAEPTAAAAALRRSGLEDMSAAVQTLQRDDTQNPGMLWVAEGAARWSGDSGSPSCARCHGIAAVTMRGVAARHPAWDPRRQRVLTLAQRIDACQREHLGGSMGADAVLALTTFVAHQSRGQPIQPPRHEALDRLADVGLRLWQQPLGQLGLSCSQCHDAAAGRRLAGSTIPQAHPTGYPIYRLEWQGIGGLTRRLRTCMVGVRAEPFAPDAMEWVALEVFLMRRAAGMPLETPGVRP
jgi:L-cysteine S-thiosulfotransferase